MEPHVPSESHPSPIGMRVVLFKVVAVLLPFILIAGAEWMARGLTNQTIISDLPGQPGYQHINPDFAGRYFRDFNPRVASNPFLGTKPDSVFRLVALGGSSTAAYPYPFYHGFPERVAARLRAQSPIQAVEVVNLGLTAANSHVLREVIPTVLRLQPDAVLIYAGHNEYYGAFGVGTGQGNRQWVRLLLTLKRSVLYRQLEAVLASPTASDSTTMARAVRNASILLHDPAYGAGLAQFERNMSAILERLDQAGLPTFVGTVVSNVYGQPPLGELPEAADAWNRAVALQASGNAERAAESFQRAKELDPVRFRAPDSINVLLRTLAASHGATLVELAAPFDGPGSDSLFTDHLHPTAAGYDLIADAFTQAVIGSAYTGPALHYPPAPVDAAYAQLLIERLKGGFPFTQGLSLSEEVRRFRQALEDRLHSGTHPDSLAAQLVGSQIDAIAAHRSSAEHALANHDTVTAMAHMRALLYWNPFSRPLRSEAVQIASESNSGLSLAGEIVSLAARTDPAEDYLNTLAAIRIRQRAWGPAQELLSEVERRNPASTVMLYNTARLWVLTGDTLAAQSYFARYQAASRH